MADQSKRIFLKAGGLAMVSLGLDPMFLNRVAAASNGKARDRKKTLICVFQRGAVDGVSMLVPHGDEAYYSHRNRIAITRPGTEGGALDLDGYFGLHPAIEALHPLYRPGIANRSPPDTVRLCRSIDWCLA